MIQFTGIDRLPFNIKSLNQLLDEGFFDSIRYYNGNPSVTSVLSLIDSPFYFSADKETMKIAMDNGTLLHETIEESFKQEKFIECTSKQAKSWKKFHTENNEAWNPVALEEQFIGKTIGGTLDAIMEIDGKKYLVDWKSAKAKPASFILTKYRLQLSAYYGLSRNKYEIHGAKIVAFLKTKYHIIDITKNELDMYSKYFKILMHNFLTLKQEYERIRSSNTVLTGLEKDLDK